MSNPTRYDYDSEYYNYDEENGLITHFDSEGGTEAFDAETGKRVSLNDDD